MKTVGFIWHKEWVHSYMSNWGVFERFKFANALSNQDILHLFGNAQVKAVKNLPSLGGSLRSLIYLTGIDEKKSRNILKVNLHTRGKLIEKKLFPILGMSHGNFINGYVRYCPTCIKHGFHSIFHQLSILNHCVFHPNITLIDSCIKCGAFFREYRLSNDSSPPFTCACGCSVLESENVISIFNSWKTKFAIQDKEILKLLRVYLHQKETPVFIHPGLYLGRYNTINLDLLSDYVKNYYLNVSLNAKASLKEVFNQNSLSSQNALKNALYTYRDTFHYRYQYRSFVQKDEIDALYYEVYLQSRHIYKVIKRFLIKHHLKEHTVCIHLNNELLKANTYCRLAVAFSFWREEFEDVQLSKKVRKAPVETSIFNFKCYEERFSLYPKGGYCNYLEVLLDNYFNISHNFDLVDLHQIKKIMSTLLAYFLLERFYQYVDLTLQPAKYKARNYYLSNEIPIHLIAMDEQTHKMTIYTQNVFEKLKRLIQDAQIDNDICGFDRNKQYEPYLTPLQQAIFKMDFKNRKD